MALTANSRKKLLKLVQDSKRILFQEIKDQLQQYYGIFPQTGEVLAIEELTTSDADVLYNAKLLRDRLKYLANNLADSKNENVESVEQLIREQAFTVLNRLAALRMAEERGIIRETIKNSYTSEGFQVYDSITGQGATTNIYTRYKWYLYAIFDELSIDLPSVFDKFSPYAIIFPSERSLQDLLNLINNEDLEIHREEGYPIVNLWKQDETIGWIYQYYNSKEEIKAMRDASSAPRNSRELAVRNQFFTPRYVVQFLTDNSLGRIWYEMNRGNTKLIEFCPYLIVQENEVFLDNQEIKPDNSDDNLNYIEYRKVKDPRELKLLDPACGSMHFGLYAFDVFEVIYLEAWDNHKDLMVDLKNSTTRADFIKQIPEFIIRYNIHGVDIDPRALQIAALSLWLRAQKSFDNLGLEPADRPQITKSNLVLAEPMPINADFLSEVVKSLDAPMRKLVLDIWELMKLAGETGLLLRIENEIDSRIQEIAKNLQQDNKHSQTVLGASEEQLMVAEQAAIYASKQYKENFLDNAEEKVLEILKSLAENTNDDKGYQKLLFAEDSARGFAFIELCRQKYDVIVMNPPFGSWSKNLDEFKNQYKDSAFDIYAAFISRFLDKLQPGGYLSAITSKSGFYIDKGASWRSNIIPKINHYADFGFGVLDAMVEVSAYVLSNDINLVSQFFDFRGKTHEYSSASDFYSKAKKYNFSYKDIDSIPTKPLAYWINNSTIELFQERKNLLKSGWCAQIGVSTKDDFRFLRNLWEVSDFSKFKPFAKGGEYSRFWLSFDLVINYGEKADELDAYLSNKYPYLKGNTSWILHPESDYLELGLTYTRRSSKGISIRILPSGCIFSDMGRGIIKRNVTTDELYFALGLTNSKNFREMISLFTSNIFEGGVLNSIPFIDFDFKDSKHIEISELSNNIAKIIYTYSTIEEWASNYSGPWLLRKYENNIKSTLKKIFDLNIENQNQIKNSFNKINLLSEIIFKSKSIITEDEDYSWIPEINESTLINQFMSYLFGLCFNRYDISKLFDDNDIKLNFEKDLIKSKEQKDFVSVNFNHENLEFIINEITTKLELTVADYSYLLEKLNKKSILDFFQSKEFFDYHLTTFSRSRRISPIYWPLSSKNGSYTIWINYLEINDQTLFKIINSCIKPKIEQIRNENAIFSFNNELSIDEKLINNKNELILLELQDFENDILNIVNLPYKPNHDDGVLITASPLYKLFRHSKWKKSTEECWKKLEKGEFDWAHLAYTIWPERVTKKCKKDLSMAIAHGLESICEIKPKVVKERIKKEPKEIKKDLKLNL